MMRCSLRRDSHPNTATVYYFCAAANCTRSAATKPEIFSNTASQTYVSIQFQYLGFFHTLANCSQLPMLFRLAIIFYLICATLNAYSQTDAPARIYSLEYMHEMVGTQYVQTVNAYGASKRSAQIAIPFNQLESLDDLRIELMNRKGKTKTLAQHKLEITALSGSSFYAGRKAYLIPLPDDNTSFHYSFASTHTSPMHLASLSFWNYLDCDTIVHQVVVPDGYVFKFKLNQVHALDSVLTIDSVTRNNSTVYTFTHVRDYDQEGNTRLPIICCLYPNTFASGKAAMFNWYQQLLLAVPKPNAELKHQYNEALTGISGKAAVINSTFEFVKGNISYIAIEDGINAFRPRDPNDIFVQKKGDCKDMAFMIQGLLESKGIQCDLALSSTSGHWTELTFPSLACANHVIAVCKLDGELYYLDATEDLCEFGNPSCQIADSWIFLLDENEGQFHHIPSADTSHYSNLTIDLSLQGRKLVGHLKVVHTGINAVPIRTIIKQSRPALLERYLKQTWGDQLPAYTVDSIEVVCNSADSVVISASIKAPLHLLANMGSSTAILPGLLPLPHAHLNTETDTLSSHALYKTMYTQTTFILNGLSLKGAPAERSERFESGTFEYAVNYRTVNNQLLFKTQFTHPSMVITPETWPAFLEINETIKNYYQQSFTF